MVVNAKAAEITTSGRRVNPRKDVWRLKSTRDASWKRRKGWWQRSSFSDLSKERLQGTMTRYIEQTPEEHTAHCCNRNTNTNWSDSCAQIMAVIAPDKMCHSRLNTLMWPLTVNTKVIYLSNYYQTKGGGVHYLHLHDLPDITQLRKIYMTKMHPYIKPLCNYCCMHINTLRNIFHRFADEK